MSSIEQRLEQALARIAALEAGGGRNDRALSGWERFRAFFTGKTKLDGTGLQVKVGANGDGQGAIAFLPDFYPDVVDDPPATRGQISVGEVESGAIERFTQTTVTALDLADQAGTPSLPYVQETAEVLQTVSDAQSSWEVSVEYPGSTGIRENAVVSLAGGDDSTSVIIGGVVVLVDGSLYLRSHTTPAQITSNQDDYDPDPNWGYSVFRLSTDVSRNITGWVPAPTGKSAQGRVIFLLNIGAQNIVLVNDATSTAANRFLLGANVTIGPDEGVTLWYDDTTDRWRCAGKHV